MRNFTVKTALLLCSLSWFSVSATESQTLEVQPGGEVTLRCSNFSSSATQMFWFKLVNRTKPQCVSYMFRPLEPASLCDGFKNGKFEMSTNISTLFLKIKQVDLSDSGLYFCGYPISNNPLIVTTTYLQVQVVEEVVVEVQTVILGGLTVFLVMVVICLAVKFKRLQRARAEEQNLQQTETQGSDDLNYAAVTFHPRTKRNHRPESETQEEPEVIYSPTRSTQEAPGTAAESGPCYY